MSGYMSVDLPPDDWCVLCQSAPCKGEGHGLHSVSSGVTTDPASDREVATDENALPDGEEGELNVRQTAEVLGVSENTVRNWTDRGVLPVARKLPSGFRRFDSKEVKRMRDEMWQGFENREPLLGDEGRESRRFGGPFVSARITLGVALQVPLDAPDEEKDDAAEAAMQELIDDFPGLDDYIIGYRAATNQTREAVADSPPAVSGPVGEARVEAVARAIYEAQNANQIGPPPWDDTREFWPATYKHGLSLARAAIAEADPVSQGMVRDGEVTVDLSHLSRADLEWFVNNPGSTAASKPIREAVRSVLAREGDER